MSFGLDLQRFGEKVERRRMLTQQRATQLAFESIVNGSQLTGAPGQPVQSGALRSSWQIELGPWRSLITSNLIYAPFIEEGMRDGIPLVLRSGVGGFHSVFLTRISWRKLLAQAALEVAAA